MCEGNKEGKRACGTAMRGAARCEARKADGGGTCRRDLYIMTGRQ